MIWSMPVASGSQIPGLGCSAKGRPIEIERGRDWLRPDRNYSHRVLNLRLIGD